MKRSTWRTEHRRGREIPYRPEALARKKENFENRMKVKVTNDPHRYDTGEPELQCYRPGRAARQLPTAP